MQRIAALEAFSQLNSSHSIRKTNKETNRNLEAVVVDWYLDWQRVVPTGNQMKDKSKVVSPLCYCLKDSYEQQNNQSVLYGWSACEVQTLQYRVNYNAAINSQSDGGIQKPGMETLSSVSSRE